MKRILKYRLNIVDEQILDMPYTAEIISVMEQRDDVVLYAVVDDDHPTDKRSIIIAGTGHPLPDIDHHVYLGTVSTDKGSLVWHIFEGR